MSVAMVVLSVFVGAVACFAALLSGAGVWLMLLSYCAAGTFTLCMTSVLTCCVLRKQPLRHPIAE